VGRMIRKQLYMDVELDRALAVRAAATGESQAEIVREAVSRHLAGTSESARDAKVRELEALWEQDRRAGFTMGGRMPARGELHERRGWHFGG
jgi:hypothetical protein